MPTKNDTVSLADLAAAGISIRPSEACALVRELALQLSRGEIHGLPSPQVVRLSADGALLVEGPVAAGGSSVTRAAQLLESLLPPPDAPPERRVPGALRLALARALGTLDLPPYPSLEDFANALSRFADLDAQAIARDLYRAWVSAADASESFGLEAAGILPTGIDPSPEPGGELTVSDIRRARRATGLTLGQIEERSRIPIALLRQLEWGYLENWPTGQYGRVQLVRYARAAGLDEQVVLATILPLLQESAAAVEVESVPVVTEAPATTMLQQVEPPMPADIVLVRPAEVLPRVRRRPRALPAVAAAALVAVALGSATWNQRTRREVDVKDQRTVREVDVRDQRTAREPDVSAVPTTAPASTPAPPERAPDAADVKPSPRVDALPASANRVDLAADDPTYSPAFATEGSAMFYHEQGTASSALMRADTDGGGAILRITRIVDDHSRNFHARPSPDGTRIAFDSDRSGERAVFVANADGTDVRRVTGEGYAAVPSWSPDSQTLIVVRAEPGRPKVWNLWSIDVKSGQSRRLTNHAYGQPWGASWFPDGRRVAYSHEDRLLVMDIASGARRIYRSPKPGALLRTPAVSPDGKRLIFQVHRDGAWVLELSDGSMRKVLADPSAEEFTWSSDGRRVAYHSRQSGTWGVWLMHAR